MILQLLQPLLFYSLLLSYYRDESKYELLIKNFDYVFADVNGKKTTLIDCKTLKKFFKPPPSILSLKGGYPMVSYTMLQINTQSKEQISGTIRARTHNPLLRRFMVVVIRNIQCRFVSPILS